MKRTIFNEEHDMFRDSVRRFMQREIGPHIEQWREAGICDPDAFSKAGEQGLLCMWVEEEYGGLGMKWQPLTFFPGDYGHYDDEFDNFGRLRRLVVSDGAKINDYFSYEHFYVIYCKFWQLAKIALAWR